MICQHCGNQLKEDDNFCPKCGGVIGVYAQEAVQGEPVYYAPRSAEPPMGNGVVSLIFGILSIVFPLPQFLWGILLIHPISWIPVAFSSVIGLILSIISKRLAKTFNNTNAKGVNLAVIGKHLATVGLIASIVLLAILVGMLIFILLCVALALVIVFMSEVA